MPAGERVRVAAHAVGAAEAAFELRGAGGEGVADVDVRAARARVLGARAHAARRDVEHPARVGHKAVGGERQRSAAHGVAHSRLREQRAQLVVRRADEAQLAAQPGEARRLDREKDGAQDERPGRRRAPARTPDARLERREPQHRVAGEHAQRHRRNREVALDDRQPRDARRDERQRARAEQRDRHRHPRDAEAAHGEHEPDHTRERDRRPRDVGEERHERARDVTDPAHPAELLGELARRVQAVERVAGDGEVDERPAQRRRDDEREQPGALARPRARPGTTASTRPPAPTPRGAAAPPRRAAPSARAHAAGARPRAPRPTRRARGTARRRRPARRRGETRSSTRRTARRAAPASVPNSVRPSA